MADGYYISPDDLQTYRNLIKDNRGPSVDNLPYGDAGKEELYYVKLDADLTATTDDSTPTTVDASIYYPQDDDTLADSGENIEITNRFNVEASSGDLLLVIHQHGEYIPLFASGGGGGGGGGGCCQVETEIFDIVTANGQPGSGKRSITNKCDGGVPLACRAYFDGSSDAAEPGGTGAFSTRNRNEGYIEWSTASAPELTYDPARDLWLKDISSEIKVYDSTGTDVTGTATNIDGELQENPTGSSIALWVQATYSGAQKYGYFQWQMDNRTPGLDRPPLTRARTYTQNSNADANAEVGSLHLCSKPVQFTPSGTVEFALVPAVTSSTDGDNGVTISYTITLRVTNNSSENITVHYDPNDMGGGHWASWNGAIGFSGFATATTYGVTAGSTNNKVILTRTNDSVYWGYGHPTPDAIRILTAGEQYAIGDTSADQYDSGVKTGSFTYYRGGSVVYV